MGEVLNVVFTAVGSFVTLFIIAKLLGKKQVGELDFIDYVVGISIGSISAEMATNTADKPFYDYLIGMVIYFLLTLFIDILSTKASCLKRFFKGTPLVIIKNGEIDYKQLKKSKLDVNDLTSLAREKGYFNFSDIAFGIFETNGSLSVIPKGNQKPITIEDLKIEPEKASMPQNIIVDGEISKFSLKMLNKNKQWLFEKLNITSKKDLKKILLAVYNEEDDNFSLFYK